jgi:hypothetical protein
VTRQTGWHVTQVAFGIRQKPEIVQPGEQNQRHRGFGGFRACAGFRPPSLGEFCDMDGWISATVNGGKVANARRAAVSAPAHCRSASRMTARTWPVNRSRAVMPASPTQEGPWLQRVDWQTLSKCPSRSAPFTALKPVAELRNWGSAGHSIRCSSRFATLAKCFLGSMRADIVVRHFKFLI